MNDQMLQVMPDQFVNQMAGQMKKFKKESITCLTKKLKAIKLVLRRTKE